MEEGPEFLIRCVGAEWWPRVDFARVLRPRSVDSTPCDGWGNHRIRIGVTEVSFSDEDPGWQVSFRGPFDGELARQVVDEILLNLQEATGLNGRVVEL